MRRAPFKFLTAIAASLIGSSVCHANTRTPVPVARRALVAAVNLSIMTERKFTAHYKLEEGLAAQLLKRKMRRHYGSMTVLTREDATYDRFFEVLGAELRNPEIQAVDLFIDLHGYTAESHGEPQLCFIHEDRKTCVPSREIRDRIIHEFSVAERAKLRAMYSDACHGDEQIQDWLDAGLKAVGGSRRSDQNRSIDIRRWLGRWTRGENFGEAIEHANKALVTPILDKLGRGDSLKTIGGDPEVRIDSI